MRSTEQTVRNPSGLRARPPAAMFVRTAAGSDDLVERGAGRGGRDDLPVGEWLLTIAMKAM